MSDTSDVRESAWLDTLDLRDVSLSVLLTCYRDELKGKAEAGRENAKNKIDSERDELKGKAEAERNELKGKADKVGLLYRLIRESWAFVDHLTFALLPRRPAKMRRTARTRSATRGRINTTRSEEAVNNEQREVYAAEGK